MYVELFRIYRYNLNSLEESLYFCNHPDVSFEGQAYQAIACETKDFNSVGKGPLPTPTITVNNFGRVVGDLIYQIDQSDTKRLEGAWVERILTEHRFLDGQSDAGSSVSRKDYSRWVIEQVPRRNYKAVEFKLRTPYDIEGVILPGRQCTHYCSWTYRTYPCTWAGGYFDRNNNATTEANDECNKTLAACKVRFGNYAALPFGGHPGIDTFY